MDGIDAGRFDDGNQDRGQKHDHHRRFEQHAEEDQQYRQGQQ